MEIGSDIKSEFYTSLMIKSDSNILRGSSSLSPLNSLSTATKYYSVKTKKVDLVNNYDTSRPSLSECTYLHIFTDKTSSQKLKTEQANREYQRLMLSSVAHEFRNPLSSVSGNLDLIQIVSSDPKVKEFAKRAKNS